MFKILCLTALVALCIAGDCIIDDYDACPNPSDGDFARAHEGILYCCNSSITSFMELNTANGKVESCSCILSDDNGSDDDNGNDNNDNNDDNASSGGACINDRDACPDIDDTEFTRAHEGVIYCCDKSTTSFMDLITDNGLVVSCQCIAK